jgi:amino acid adenylation domain-containing protein
MHGVPSFGFARGNEALAHRSRERIEPEAAHDAFHRQPPLRRLRPGLIRVSPSCGRSMTAPATLAGLLAERAVRHPDRAACVFLVDGEDKGESLTYSQLHREACRVAALLAEEGLRGERALLLFPPGLAFVAAWFGCLYGGVVAVPVYPPRSNRNVDRLQAITADADARAVLATGDVMAGLAQYAVAAPGLATLRWIEVDEAGADSAGWTGPEPGPGDVAFLQYTSGSTSTPKGVRVTHANLMANERMLRDAFGHQEGLVVAGWLPVYHDMGLIGNLLHPLYMGGTCVLMSPAAFLQRPARWLEAVSQYGAGTSGGPNFAYDLCVERVSAQEKAALDLSAWRAAFCGAEPVRAATLDRFAAAFAECGFRRDAFYPCYGLAEATLFVTGGQPEAGPVVREFRADALERDRAVPAPCGEEGAARHVGCGFPWREGRVEIVRPGTGRPCTPGEVGEIWASGPHVAAGYWNRPDATAESFGAFLGNGDGPFLRTGDLGFIDDGELFVTGRAKDLIILRGRNLYPQDIEATAGAAHPALQPGGGAAFSIDEDGEEGLVIVHEVRRTALRSLDTAAVALRVREAVAAAHEAAVHDVVLISPLTLMKTSSGKVQRQATRRAYREGSLSAAVAQAQAEPAAASADPPAPPLAAFLRDAAAEVLRVSPADVRLGLSLPALGLDSVGAARLAARVEEKTGVPIDPVALLEPRPLAELAAELASFAPRERPETAAGAADERDPFALTPGQRALWFLHRMAPEGAAYNVAVAVRVRGPLDPHAVQAALDQVMARHAALRTVLDEDAPVQRVLARGGTVLRRVDADGWEDGVLQARLDDEARLPFHFADGPPVRAHLYRRGADDHVLLLAAHHAALDFRSLEIVFDELFRTVVARMEGGTTLYGGAGHYPVFARWQAELLAGPEGERLRARVVERLSGAPTMLALPTDRPRPAVRGERGRAHAFALDAELSARLHALARTEGVTPYVLLLAAFQVLLHRWSGQDDFLVGSPAGGRTRPAFAETVGYLVNLVVLRARLDGDPSFRALLARTRAEALAALGTQAYPFERLVEQLQPERDPSRTPMVQALFVLQQADRLPPATACALGIAGVAEARGPLVLESLAVETGAAQFDLALAMGEVDGAFAGTLRYDADLFDAATIRRMAAQLARLLDAVSAAPGTPLSRLDLLPADEARQVLDGFNATDVRYADAQLPIHRLVEAQAARTPDAVAVSFQDEHVTCAELDRRANRLAHRLRRVGVVHETRVGVCLERSVEMVVALLGVLKAGGAYVPVDPGYPAERIGWMLADSAVPVLLTQARLAAALPEHAAHVIRLDADWPSIEREPESAPRVAVPADGLAYVIYTSGSTGRPKGAMNAHRGVVNRLLWMQAEYELGAGDVVLQKTPFSFDVSVWEFFWPLMAGARLVMARPEGHRDPAYISEVIGREGVTTLHFVPSMLRAFLEHGEAARCGSVRRVMSSGEALPAEVATAFFRALPWAELHNLYGPTEATVDVTHWRCGPADGVRPVPIGKPLANTRVYVLDRAGRPAPMGAPGELCIGGVQVGRGYLGRPALTAQAFIPDPFSAEPGARLYRTGDLARWRPGGVAEYLGRMDHQIKVRGFRIEPGEVEAVLAAHPAVGACVVAAREETPGEARLVAYTVAAAGARAPSADELRAFVRERLPEHMVPLAWVALQALPLSPSGKIDRKALPAPGRGRTGTAYVAPRSEVEQTLERIWAEVLDVERVGVHDDFFALGGYSLLAVQVAARVQQAFGVSLPLHTLFQATTIEALSRRIAHAQLVVQPEDELLELLAEMEAAALND